MEPRAILGGLTPERFLAEHWQKKPLLVRGAVPGFEGPLSPDDLAALATLEEARARIVRLRRGRWTLEEGPFDESTFRALPARDWTLLVQGVNHYLREGEAILQWVDFLPHARLDDLMVSYAPPGGSVGPHFDSYDVFLLQGIGHRRWQISAQEDRALVAGAPLRILERFRPEEEWVLGPGDLLYLPPRYAHYGVALDECMTWSIGFRAPTAAELAARFLEWLPERLCPEGLYADPDLRARRHPAEIDDAMVERVAGMLAQIRWDRELVGRFLGQYLSEPKAHVIFERPARPMSAAAFARRVGERGVRLALKSQMLARGTLLFVNGEAVEPPRAGRAALLRLADERRLPPGVALPGEAMALLYEWYRAGWVEAGPAPRSRR